MDSRKVVRGAKIHAEKLWRAKELRQAMTSGEKILWRHLRDNRLGGFHFRRQQVIDGFIADFYCDSAGLVVEVDGDIHRQQVAYDQERETILHSRGLAILRVSESEAVKNVETVLEKILEAVRAAGRRT